MPAQKKSTATKSAPAAAPERAKILSRADRLTAQRAAELAAAEAKREAARIRARAYHDRKRAEREAAKGQAAPVVMASAPSSPQAPAQVAVERVSKAQIVSTLEVLLASNRKKMRAAKEVRDVAYLSGVSDGLQTALSLVADLLAE